MFKNNYIFFIVPESPKKLKKFFASKKKLNAFAYLFISLVLIFAGITTFHFIEYGYLKRVAGPILRENKKLKKENKRLKEEKLAILKAMDSLKKDIQAERENHAKRLAEVTEELQKLEKFVMDIKILAGYKLPKEDAMKLKGKGGPDVDVNAYMEALSFISKRDLKEEIDKKAKEIARKLREKRNSLKDLRKFLESKHTVLSGRPQGWPLFGTITSRFGPRNGGFHTGIDIANVSGTPVFATGDGVVVFKGYVGGYGNLVEIDHGNGFSTVYAHLSRFAVELGDRVEKGDIIGYVGRSGRTTGPHLHYEVRIRGVPVNPEPYLK